MTIVRAAITQTTWTGDKESMLDKHEQFARDAAAQGAQIICFQELFYGPYFGITQDFRPGNQGYPVFQTAVGPIGVYICYDRHFPEGWREYGLGGAHMVFNPNATKPGLSNRLWEVEQPCAAVANGYFVLAPNRVGLEDNGELGSGTDEEVLIRDLDLDMVRQMRDDWQFYRDRRPETYTRTTQA